MKPIETAKQDQFGCDVIRRDEACGKVSLAEIDPDFGFESSCSTFDPEAGPNAKMRDAPKALDRIEMPIHWKGTTLYRVFAKEPGFEDPAQSPYYTILHGLTIPTVSLSGPRSSR